MTPICNVVSCTNRSVHTVHKTYTIHRGMLVEFNIDLCPTHFNEMKEHEVSRRKALVELSNIGRQ